MSKITINSFRIPRYHGDADACTSKLRIYADQRFMASDGDLILASKPGGPVWYKEIDCVVDETDLVVPSFIIDSTTNSNVTDATYSGVVFDEDDHWEDYLFRHFKIPSGLGSPIDWDAVETYNDDPPANIPGVTYTQEQVDALLEALPPSANQGVWDALQESYWLDNYNSLSEVLALIADAEAELIVTSLHAITTDTTIPANVLVKFQGNGGFTVSAAKTLTINSMDAAAPKRLFFGDGVVSVAPDACPEMYLSWWGGCSYGLAEFIADYGGGANVTLWITETNQCSVTADLQTSGTLTVGDAYEIQNYVGGVKDVTICTGGTGYANGTTTGVATTGGTGSGCTITIFGVGNVVVSAAMAAAGTGYKVGDRLTISGGGANCIVEVQSLVGTDQFQNVHYVSGFSDSALDYRYCNAQGVVFIATGTTPTTWSAGTSIRHCTTIPENITIGFKGGGTLRATGNGGGIYIKSMIDPGDRQVFTSDGSGKIFVDPNAVDEHKLIWWSGQGSLPGETPPDSTHYFKQLQQSLSVARRGGKAKLPSGIFATDRITWTANTSVTGNNSNLDPGYATEIRPYTLAATYTGIFDMQPRAVNMQFANFTLNCSSSTTVSAFRNVMALAGNYNITWDHVHFYNGTANAANVMVLDGSSTGYEFINYVLNACQWTAGTNGTCLYWRSINTGGQFNNPLFRVGQGGKCIDAPVLGFVTVINPDWRGNAGYTNTPATNRTITGAMTISNNSATMNLTEDYTAGNYLTQEDVGRYVINATGLPDPVSSTDQKFYIKHLNTPWQAVLGGGPDEDGTSTAAVTNGNVTIQEPGPFTGAVASTAIDIGEHNCLHIIGGADEGFNYFIKDGAADYRNQILLENCLIQSAIDFDGTSSSLTFVNCEVFSRMLMVTTGNPILRAFGGTVRRYPVWNEYTRFPYPGMELGVAEWFGERGNAIDFEFDSSYKDHISTTYDQDSQMWANSMGGPLQIIDPQRFGGLDQDQPLLSLLSPSTNEVDLKNFLRIGQSYYGGRIPRYYYDFLYSPLTGALQIFGNHGTASYRVLQTNANFTTSQGIRSTDPVEGIGYGTGSGGTVTQATSKSTGVTLSKTTGKITMHNASLAAGALVTFVVTNTSVRANDVPTACHLSGGTAGAYSVEAHTPVAGTSFSITVKNETGGALAEAIVIQFNLLRGAEA